jgi:hypothetical protein
MQSDEVTPEMVEAGDKAWHALIVSGQKYTSQDVLKTIYCAMQAARTPSADVGDGWQPIGTAPKDGTPILLASPVGNETRISVGFWDAEFALGWDEAAERSSWRSAWTDGTVASFSYEEYTELHPTHWRPLPDPPALAAQQEGGV